MSNTTNDNITITNTLNGVKNKKILLTSIIPSTFIAMMQLDSNTIVEK
jgi:hypothetical protein